MPKLEMLTECAPCAAKRRKDGNKPTNFGAPPAASISGTSSLWYVEMATSSGKVDGRWGTENSWVCCRSFFAHGAHSARALVWGICSVDILVASNIAHGALPFFATNIFRGINAYTVIKKNIYMFWLLF